MSENQGKSQMKPEIQKVDKKKRLYLLLGYLVSVLFLLIVIVIIIPFFKEIFSKSSLYGLIEISNLLHLTLFVLLGIPAIYLIRTGIKIIIQKRYPYHGMILMQDMKILEGKDAIKVGRKLIVLGIITIVFLISSIIITRTINRNFLNNPFSYMNYNLRKKIMNFFPKINPIKEKEYENK